MAIYFAKVNIISRGKGKSVVAAAAYRSGEQIRNDYDGVMHNYSRKDGVVCTRIVLPPKAPAQFADRGTLWNAVEKSERKNGRLAREIVLAIPREFDREEQQAAIEEYCKNFTRLGMIADYAIHDKGDGNPHAHIMLTDRPLTEDGFAAKKNRDWNKEELVEQWRAEWANVCNRRLEPWNRIDNRSYERRGMSGIKAYIHEGVAAREIEKRGGCSYRCAVNRAIRNDREEFYRLSEEHKRLEEEQRAQQREEQRKQQEKQEQQQRQRLSEELARLQAEYDARRKKEAQDAENARIRRLEEKVIVRYGEDDKNAYRGILERERAELEDVERSIKAAQEKLAAAERRASAASAEMAAYRREEEKLRTAWFGVKKYVISAKADIVREMRKEEESAKSALSAARSELSSCEQRKKSLQQGIKDRQWNERYALGCEETRKNARERLRIDYPRYDGVEKAFLRARDTILAEKGEWSNADKYKISEKMLKSGIDAERIAAALVKHAPDVHNLADAQEVVIYIVKTIQEEVRQKRRAQSVRVRTKDDDGRGRGGFSR